MRKHIFTLMALAAALCACNKEQMIESEVTEPVVEPSAPLVFTATMEGVPSSKATFDNTANRALWSLGDQVNINGFLYRADVAGATTFFSNIDADVPKEIRPVFVSTTTPESYNNSNPPSNLVDAAGTETRWCAHTDHKVSGVWNIVVSTSKAVQLYSIKLWNAENQSYSGRRWKSIKVYGSSSSQSGWTELKSIENLNLAINNSGFAGEILVKAEKEYVFYRIDVLENEGDDYMQMSDMKFVVMQGNTRPTFVSSANTQSYDNQPASNLVDDDGVDSRWIAHKTHKVNGVWNIVVSIENNMLLKNINLWNADNQSTFSGRRWKSIKVYGSASSQSGWTELKSIENLNLAINKYGFAGKIGINAKNAYTFYKIDVLDNEGDDYMQMSDMKFELEPPAPYYAYFPANLYNEGRTVLPANITETWREDKFNMPMYAHSDNTELQFKNLCGVLKIIVTDAQMSEVKSIRVSSENKAVSGAFTVANNTAVLTSPGDTDKTLTVTYSNAVPTTSEGTVFYVAIPAQTYNELTVELSSDGENFTKSMVTKAGADIVVARNRIYPINFVQSLLPAGALTGMFTVGAGPDKKVHFSKGNLQATYNGKKYTWGFAAKQYDYIGNAAGNTTIGSQSSGNVVDLFGWSTMASKYGINASQAKYDYMGGFVDWGKAIDSNGTWRTLSKNEWDYLFNSRTVKGKKGEGYSYSLDITYGGKMGLVLYPDDYAGDALSDTIESLPEGVVFLPAAGRRLGSSVGDAGKGYYWSSTAYDPNGAQSESFAHRVYFYSGSTDYSGSADTADNGSRSAGCSVRLVTKAE